MSDDRRMSNPLESFEPDFELKIDDYKKFIGQENVDALKRLAEPLTGKGWANLNSTFVGGGVAEMLRSVIPLARSLGIRAEWQTIRGNDEFFGVTKKFHNMLQGVGSEISLHELFESYLGTIDKNASNTFIASHLVVVHDPQPCALIMNGVIYGNVLWRCHIDTSDPNALVWRFLLPYINQYAGAIFTMPDFVGPGLRLPTYQIRPCIDPLAPKNHQYGENEALDILAPLFQEHNIDPERPIVAAISRYDIHKNQRTVLKAFERMCKEHHFEKEPYLIFLGNTATDDPEGGAMLESLEEDAGDSSDIKFWVNVHDNDRVVGALMKIAKCFVHVSTREGFGLVVTEALWQGTPVIGSNIGGIPAQVVDQKTGYVVSPHDIEAIASKMAHLIQSPDEAEALGKNGREHVRTNFLLPELVRRYLVLMKYYTESEKDVPEFRMNNLSYNEVMSHARRKHPYMQLDASSF